MEIKKGFKQVKKMTKEELRQTTEFKTEALALLHDLESNKLIVTKGDIPEGKSRWPRNVESRNPVWYQELFNQNHNGKKGKNSRSLIKRYLLITCLDKLSKGIWFDSFYYETMYDIIRERLYEGYYIAEHCFHVPPQFKEG